MAQAPTQQNWAMAEATMEPIDWLVAEHPVPYEVAVRTMEARVAAISAGEARELVWLLEHPPLYTAGTSARDDDLLSPERFPVHRTGRGGQYTYHGPGQRIAYVMLDLQRHSGRDVRAFVRKLEAWLIATLASLDVAGVCHADRVGIWVPRPDSAPDREDKIAALGIRVRRWISFHGISLNVAPDLEHFSGIVPCGMQEHGITSLADLGRCTDMAVVDEALRRAFEATFAPTQVARGSEDVLSD